MLEEFCYIVYMKNHNDDIIITALVDQGIHWNDKSNWIASIQCMHVPNYIKEIIKSTSPVYEQELSISNAIRIDDINALKETLNTQVCIDSIYHDDYKHIIADIESECNKHLTIDGITLIFNDD